MSRYQYAFSERNKRRCLLYRVISSSASAKPKVSQTYFFVDNSLLVRFFIEDFLGRFRFQTKRSILCNVCVFVFQHACVS